MKATILALSLTITVSLQAGMLCENVFINNSLSFDLVLTELAQLKIDIETARAQGDRSPMQRVKRAEFKNKFLELERLSLKTQEINPEDLQKLFVEKVAGIQKANEISEIKNVGLRQTESKEASSKIHSEFMHFVPIVGENLSLIFKKEEMNVTVHDFEIQGSVLSKEVFFKILTKAAKSSNFNWWTSRISIPPPNWEKGSIEERLPMTNLTVEQANGIAGVLNEMVKENPEMIADIVPDIKEGDYFYLMTKYQWILVNHRAKKFLEESRAHIGDYIWMSGDHSVNPVASKKPILVGQDAEIFDLYGNVEQVVKDELSGTPYSVGFADGVLANTLKDSAGDNHFVRTKLGWLEPGTKFRGFRFVRIRRGDD